MKKRKREEKQMVNANTGAHMNFGTCVPMFATYEHPFVSFCRSKKVDNTKCLRVRATFCHA